MSDKTSIAVKLTLSRGEIEQIDAIVQSGDGTNRADVCRKALIVYLSREARA